MTGYTVPWKEVYLAMQRELKPYLPMGFRFKGQVLDWDTNESIGTANASRRRYIQVHLHRDSEEVLINPPPIWKIERKAKEFGARAWEHRGTRFNQSGSVTLFVCLYAGEN